MAKPHSPLLWRQIHQTLSPTSHTLRTAQTCTALSSHNSTPRRPFHTTQTRSASARQTPSLRRAARNNLPGNIDFPYDVNGLKLDREGFWWGHINADVNTMLKEFEEVAHILYDISEGTTIMPPGVNFTTFKSVGEHLIRLSHSHPPTAANVRSISIGKSRPKQGIHTKLHTIHGPMNTFSDPNYIQTSTQSTESHS